MKRIPPSEISRTIAEILELDGWIEDGFDFERDAKGKVMLLEKLFKTGHIVLEGFGDARIPNWACYRPDEVEWADSHRYETLAEAVARAFLKANGIEVEE